MNCFTESEKSTGILERFDAMEAESNGIYPLNG